VTIKRDAKTLTAGIAVFIALYCMPIDAPRFDGAVHEALALTRWYAREHVLLCLVPAFFIGLVVALSAVTGFIFGNLV
jgi:hypothetical protein